MHTGEDDAPPAAAGGASVDPEEDAGDHRDGRVAVLTALRRLLREGTGLLSVRAAATVMARVAGEALGAPHVVAYLLDADGDVNQIWDVDQVLDLDETVTVALPRSPRAPADPDTGGHPPRAWPLWQRLRETRQTVLITDTTGSDSPVPDPAARERGWRACAVLPLLRAEGPVVGAVLCAHPAPHHWRTAERDLIEQLTLEGSLIVENAALREEDRRRMAALRRQSLHDPLTGLANRTLLFDRLEHVTAVARRAGHTLGVLFLDVDHFKRINDTLGHSAGDQVLIRVAETLRSCLREADTLARFAGDEFVVLLEDTSAARALAIAERIAGRLDPLRITDVDRVGGSLGEITASIGVATGSPGPGAGEVLLRHADAAMYRAKQTGRGLAVYADDRDGDLLQRDRLERDLRHALPEDGLRLHYQPVVDLATGALLGIEALLRWQHPRLGLLSPDHFLSVAEQTDLMGPVGGWVLETATRQLQRWNAGHTHPPLNLAVNVSAVQLHEGDRLLETVQAVLSDSGTDPQRLILEITETALLPDTHTPGLLAELRAMGVTIALDDFGVGYSSLRYLQKLPLDIIKVDRSFITGMEQQESSRALVAAVVSLGETLALDVVAEGIETASQRASLEEAGCPNGQGFLFAPPLPPDRIERLLRVPEGGRRHLSGEGVAAHGGT